MNASQGNLKFSAPKIAHFGSELHYSSRMSKTLFDGIQTMALNARAHIRTDKSPGDDNDHFVAHRPDLPKIVPLNRGSTCARHSKSEGKTVDVEWNDLSLYSTFSS